jgi:NADH dehydrogenase
VILIEGAERVLPPYPEGLSIKAREQLEKLGVEVRTGQRVSKIGEHAVSLGDEVIPTRTTLWAAGIAASPLARSLQTPLDSVGRVIVEPDLSIAGHPEVFVIGDLAAVSYAGGRVPGVAPAAVQGGRHVASLIKASVSGNEERPEFHYRDKGALATIGRAAAVADLGRIKLSGFFAWLVWWAIHIFFLIGFRSRFVVMFGWIWSYLSFQRGARLITGPTGIEREETKEVTAPIRSDQAS